MRYLNWRPQKNKQIDAAQSEASIRHQSRFQKRFFNWIDKRTPLSQQATLTRKNLYIIPTKTGVSFFILSFILWLLGTSYQNNLVLALSYLLISLVIVAIFHTYTNLASIEVKVLGAKPGFVGESIYFKLQVKGNSVKHHDNLTMRWWGGKPETFNFTAKQATQIEVAIEAHQRGQLYPGKFLIESVYPLGIIRCWTWLNLDVSAIVFPKPLKVSFPAQLAGSNENDQGEQISGGDDFSGLKEYRPGDPVKHIAWKNYARGQGLYSKEYSGTRHHYNWLNWEEFSHLNAEQRLSAMCYWALAFEQQQNPYGLSLPGIKIEPAIGDAHRLTVLTALACFDIVQGGF